MWGEDENARLLASIMQPYVPHHSAERGGGGGGGGYSAVVVAPDPTAANEMGSVDPIYSMAARIGSSHE